MARYRRQSRVPAALDDVWAFHSGIEGLTTVTAPWMRLLVESVRGPDGEPNPEVLVEGAEIRLSIRPFGVGPRQRWTSRIVERERREGMAWFRDEMLEGPFPKWVHTHRFVADGSGTLLTDVVEYQLPFLPGPLDVLGWPGFELMFADRHRRTRKHLQNDRS